ncbi:UPF0193 protein EVG1 homolog [Dendroctonus ponderosae]|uniref:Uncharacterized protein n=1 Tax=Dendroctonus ponderosae TaxID=77166 RepID=U4U7X2_DENPD|nr:UPF0193 protein EVG1 homolog [Dendroctonus ponderosae]ERL88423.1 hypothetical protein D910_05809 [Dendroctonus ponderosae]KAH1024967.1 hypothetical protein HUJ05_009788 [Dendroctonus ponderosae]KAH1024968.1 hypothetical protein HUJ05_009788 [Dendroctonus ponderosae]
MEWPSKNIPFGGILHPARANYSPETHQFIKVLMEESKLSMMQRKSINYSLRNGQPLPTSINSSRQKRSQIPEVTIRPGSSRRRSRNDIISSGAYEREPFRPTYPVIDREKEKVKLANMMAYNRDIEVKKSRVIKKIEIDGVKEQGNRFDQLIEEIKEREQWLKEMEQIGHAEKYRLIIQQQIQNKVREMQKLKSAGDN